MQQKETAHFFSGQIISLAFKSSGFRLSRLSCWRHLKVYKVPSGVADFRQYLLQKIENLHLFILLIVLSFNNYRNLKHTWLIWYQNLTEDEYIDINAWIVVPYGTSELIHVCISTNIMNIRSTHSNEHVKRRSGIPIF